MAFSRTEMLPSASLFLSVWVREGADRDARKRVDRLAAQIGLVPENFDADGFDPRRELWKFFAAVELQGDRAAGVWQMLQFLGSWTRSVCVAVTLDSETAWSVDGHVSESDIAAPQVEFVSFSARST